MRDLLVAPRTSWPTLGVVAAALGLWIAGWMVTGIAGIALATVGAYLAFTPLHEATHRSVSRVRAVNELVGRLASVPLFGPLVVIRDIHLEHHKHTNDPVADPDHWSGRGPAWLLPLRWLTQDARYYWIYARRARPPLERIEAYGTMVLFVATALVLASLGHGRAVVLYWLLPARLAIGVLAYAFDYVPHRPHQITAKQDRMRATSVSPGRWRYLASLGQSLHLVHHLYPAVPFYRYHRVLRVLEGRGVIPSHSSTVQTGSLSSATST
jgi:beta-carotene hydroxylase